MKAYMVIASPRFATRGALQRHLDGHRRVAHWYSCLPNCIFVFTEMSAQQLAKDLEGTFGLGSGRRFVVSEVSVNRQGRLPADLWALLRDPERVATHT